MTSGTSRWTPRRGVAVAASTALRWRSTPAAGAGCRSGRNSSRRPLAPKNHGHIRHVRAQDPAGFRAPYRRHRPSGPRRRLAPGHRKLASAAK